MRSICTAGRSRVGGVLLARGRRPSDLRPKGGHHGLAITDPGLPQELEAAHRAAVDMALDTRRILQSSGC